MSSDIAKYPTLALVDSTQELHLLSEESLSKPCNELHRYLLDSVSRSSGHFASGPDTVELIVVLRHVYNTPFGQLIWDTGHQAYLHRILTGRRDRIGTIRQKGDLHPFPRRGENEYDVLSVGHSSTSINAGIGTAVATGKEGKERRIVCVIGDGAITAGMALEAMDHAGDTRPDMLAILSDNEISISENVGMLGNHLAQLLSDKLHPPLYEGGKKTSSGVSPIKELLKRVEEHVKGTVVPGILFEELSFNYIGPTDGYDVLGLITALKNMYDLKGPQFLHIMTRKDRSYEPTEEDPIVFHAIFKFDPSSGCLPKSSDGLPSCSKIFGDWLYEIAARNNKLMTITPAVREGSGMVEFLREFPDCYFDVAIVEQYAVTSATGLAIGSYKPVVAIYSIFLRHAYDRASHDVAIQKLPVLSVVDRVEIVGADGQTHQGAFGLSLLRCIPEVVIMTPSDENECHQMLSTGYHYNDDPAVVCYPRGNTVSAELISLEQLPTGKGIVKHHGEKVAVLNLGTLVPEAVQVVELLNTTLVDIRFVKPLDETLILEMTTQHEVLVTIEENAITGGVGSSVSEMPMARRRSVPVLNIGLPDLFISQGTQDEVRADLGLNVAGVKTKVKVWLA